MLTIQGEYVGRHRNDGPHDDCHARAQAYLQIRTELRRSTPLASSRRAGKDYS